MTFDLLALYVKVQTPLGEDFFLVSHAVDNGNGGFEGAITDYLRGEEIHVFIAKRKLLPNAPSIFHLYKNMFLVLGFCPGSTEKTTSGNCT